MTASRALALLVASAALLGACSKGGDFYTDGSGDEGKATLAYRVAELEAKVERLEEVEEFIRPIMEQQKAAQAEQAASEPDPDVRFAVPVENDPIIGPEDAPVTIVKAFDFACPYCMQVSPILDDIVQQYDGKVRVAYKHFVVHPDTAMDAHLAACAAAQQGKFKEFKNAFWEKGFGAYMETRDPEKMSRDNILEIARSVGLNLATLKSDMEGVCPERVQQDMQQLSTFRVSGTPSFFINGKFTMFSGPGPFLAKVDDALKAAEASGIPAGDYYQKAVIEEGEQTFKSRSAGE